MLQPNVSTRPTAPELFDWICESNKQLSVASPYVGRCCEPSTILADFIARGQKDLPATYVVVEPPLAPQLQQAPYPPLPLVTTYDLDDRNDLRAGSRYIPFEYRRDKPTPTWFPELPSENLNTSISLTQVLSDHPSTSEQRNRSCSHTLSDLLPIPQFGQGPARGSVSLPSVSAQQRTTQKTTESATAASNAEKKPSFWKRVFRRS